MDETEPVIVNPIAAEEIPAWARSIATAFMDDPEAPATQRWIDARSRDWEPDRAWGALAGGRWVASLRAERRSLTVPGALGVTLAGAPGVTPARALGAVRELGVDALTNVTVAATHRRRGLMSEMVTRSLEAAGDRGDPASVLIASEGPIYGRFGYAPATLLANYTLDRRRPGATCSGDAGRLRTVDRERFRELAPAVFDAARQRDAGQMNRDHRWWSSRLGGDGYEPIDDDLPHNWLVHEGDGGPDGLLAWRAHGTPSLVPPLFTVDVWVLASASDLAYRNMWAYLTGLDLVDEVRLTDRSVHEPVRWLLPDARALVLTRHVDFLWLRLLDVPAALSARRYACPGELVLEVIDEDAGGFAAGRYRLEADGDEVRCTRTTATVDLRIDQRALASIYLGGFRLAELPSGSASESRPGAFARTDLMFSTPVPPWNATPF